ncbi:odorant receptor 42a-like [Teleopsis dalmanni]|uniref:odorant receptor 42a-like n=1 Tax=Teleopsis dalmanni TaxID=139649 RepID=UPI0018CCA22D|nr:odorant receptor 42a-like [Teleopsis dalmanni]
MYPQCYVALIIGHVRALAERIKRIGVNPKASGDDNLEELLACIQDHKDILSYLDCIRPVISRTLLQQFIVTGFVLCLTGISLTVFARDAAQILFTGTYLIAVLVETFPCCWFVNLLVQESDYLTTAMYSCNWYTQNQKFRKTLIIFMQRSQKSNVIMAGNLAPITLQTFLAVIRFSFSMFTILSKANI